MKNLKQILLASLCALCLAPAANATVITFDGSTSGWNTAYDSAGVNVVFQTPAFAWSSGYNNLNNVAYTNANTSLIIDFIALGGMTINLNSFDLGNYLGNGAQTGYTIYDLSNLVTPVVPLVDLVVPYATTSHTSVNVGLSSSAGFRLSVGPDLYNIAIDNINFTTSAATVPEPGTALLAGLALVGLFVSRKKTASQNASQL